MRCNPLKELDPFLSALFVDRCFFLFQRIDNAQHLVLHGLPVLNDQSNVRQRFGQLFLQRRHLFFTADAVNFQMENRLAYTLFCANLRDVSVRIFLYFYWAVQHQVRGNVQTVQRHTD